LPKKKAPPTEEKAVKPPFAGVSHLLVDLDGTLVGARDFRLATDFVIKAISAVREFGGTRKGIRALSAVLRALEGKPKPEHEGKTNAAKAVEAFGSVLGMGAEQAQTTLVQSARKIFPTLAPHFFPMPGAKDFIEWAKGHYPLILATNPVWPQDIVEMRIRWAGIDPAVFRRITLAKEMSASKPWLNYYNEVLSQEKLKAEECLLIGNDMKKDLPATQVGIRVYIVDSEAKNLKPLETEKGISAYRGTFAHLRGMLESVAV
jgi:FMN phosphatase YigB (HAD superfamily)